MELAADSLERLIPEELQPGDVTGRETLRLHLERYEFAARYARGGRVLDIACGVGYGTQLLADRSAEEVALVGVDVSQAALDYARRHYGGKGIEYLTANAMEFHDPAGFDLIVSLETVEHLPAPAEFVTRLACMLRPLGVLVTSVPTTPSVDLNPHHCHDFTEGSFRRLVRPHGLRELEVLRQVQPVRLGSLLTRHEARMREVRRNIPAYYLRHPAAFGRRVWSTLTRGFAIRYLTIALQRPD